MEFKITQLSCLVVVLAVISGKIRRMELWQRQYNDAQLDHFQVRPHCNVTSVTQRLISTVTQSPSNRRSRLRATWRTAHFPSGSSRTAGIKPSAEGSSSRVRITSAAAISSINFAPSAAITEEHRIVRTCGWIKSAKPCAKQDTFDLTETVCQCFDDGCNGSSVVSINFATILFISGAALVRHFNKC